MLANSLALKLFRFDIAQTLLNRDYYITVISGRSTMYSFGVMAREVDSMEQRKRRLSSRRADLVADILIERAEGSFVTREDILQGDFVLHLSSLLRKQHRWHPSTHVFASSMHRPFEMFARSSSRAFFAQFAKVLGVGDVEALKSLVAKLGQYGDGFNSGDPSVLTGLDELCTRP